MSRRKLLTPLQAYDRAETQRRQLGMAFRAKILGLHIKLQAHTPEPPRQLSQERRRGWLDAMRLFASTPAGTARAIIAAYRDLAIQRGLQRIDPSSRAFKRDLRAFHRNYITNFPLPEEQESRGGFRDLWRASPREGGYEEVGYSVLCPLTGRYLMGCNFTIQPRSHSVNFIYGFISPCARGIGLSEPMIALMRETAQQVITQYYQRSPADRPTFLDGAGPLIVFEKNVIEDMSLTDILMDSAHVDIDHPPDRTARLVASSISQNMRDSIWDRRGARIIDYGYIQSSLDGVVRVPDSARSDIVALLSRMPLDASRRRTAEATLAACLRGRLPGCRTLCQCAFVDPARRSVPAAQIRLANEIFQGISVVKDPMHLTEDIYFQGQVASLDAQAPSGTVALRSITPAGIGARDFDHAERITRRLLAGLTWAELRKGRERTYGEWLQQKKDVVWAEV